MTPRKGKCVLLNLNNDWKIDYGTFEIKKPITLYIKLQTYITPLDNKIDGDIIFNSISNYHIPDDSIFCPRFIQKTAFASTKTKQNKQSCLVITLTVKQKEELVPFNMIEPHIISLVSDFISKITSEWDFNFILNSKKQNQLYGI